MGRWGHVRSIHCIPGVCTDFSGLEHAYFYHAKLIGKVNVYYFAAVRTQEIHSARLNSDATAAAASMLPLLRTTVMDGG